MPNTSELPTPVTADQKFMAKAAGMNVDTPTPITPEQKYLKKISEGGGSSGDAYTKTETDALLGGKADLVDGKVPASELPSYVDDVLEYTYTTDFPATGESGKIYVATSTNRTYRWSGSAYVEISESLALGETSSTAYAGDKGKANADAITAIKDGTTIDSFGDVETALAGKQATLVVGTNLDNVPTQESTNPITSGGVYTALQNLPTGGTDLTPVNVGAKAATFPTEYVYVLEKHLPFTTGQTASVYSGSTWIYYTENSYYYVYIQYLGETISSSFNEPITYRYAIINKSDKTWTQGAYSDVSTVITTKTVNYLAFKGNATPLSSNKDLDYIFSGLFFCPNASNVIHSPTKNPFLIESQQIMYYTTTNYEYIKQILTDFTTKDVYYRTRSNATWSSWYKINATVVS